MVSNEIIAQMIMSGVGLSFIGVLGSVGGSMAVAMPFILAAIAVAFEGMGLGLFAFVEGSLVVASIYVEVLKEHHILVGADDSFYLFKVGLAGIAALCYTGGIHALLVVFSGFVGFLAGCPLLCGEFLQLGLLSLGELKPLEKVDTLLFLLFTGVAVADVFFLCSIFLFTFGLSHARERNERKGYEG